MKTAVALLMLCVGLSGCQSGTTKRAVYVDGDVVSDDIGRVMTRQGAQAQPLPGSTRGGELAVGYATSASEVGVQQLPPRQTSAVGFWTLLER